MRLYVRVSRPKQLLGAFDGQAFCDVDELAAAVVALARIAFRVFVRQHGALSLENPRTRVVLRGDKFDMILLPAALA